MKSETRNKSEARDAYFLAHGYLPWAWEAWFHTLSPEEQQGLTNAEMRELAPLLELPLAALGDDQAANQRLLTEHISNRDRDGGGTLSRDMAAVRAYHMRRSDRYEAWAAEQRKLYEG